MKMPLLVLLALPFIASAMEYEIQSDDEFIRVSTVVLDPKEEVGMHRDEFARYIYVVQGGTLMQTFEDGRIRLIDFPTGKTLHLNADPVGVNHTGASLSNEKMEFIVIEIKTNVQS
jgi:quercetin dioxygenase-like cupin family protein